MQQEEEKYDGRWKSSAKRGANPVCASGSRRSKTRSCGRTRCTHADNMRETWSDESADQETNGVSDARIQKTVKSGYKRGWRSMSIACRLVKGSSSIADVRR